MREPADPLFGLVRPGAGRALPTSVVVHRRPWFGRVTGLALAQSCGKEDHQSAALLPCDAAKNALSIDCTGLHTIRESLRHAPAQSSHPGRKGGPRLLHT